MSLVPLPQPLVVEHAVSNGHHTLSLSGDLDIASAATLKGRLLEASGEGTVGMTLDLSRLTFVDSTGISIIVLARKLAEEHGFGLTLIPGSREIQRVFDLIGLLDVLPFRADGEDPLMDPWI